MSTSFQCGSLSLGTSLLGGSNFCVALTVWIGIHFSAVEASSLVPCSYCQRRYPSELEAKACLNCKKTLERATAVEPTFRVKDGIYLVGSLERQGYLQQVCGYLRDDKLDRGGVGRIFPVDEGIIGAAFGNGHIWRTKYYDNTLIFQAAKRESMLASGDLRAPEEVGESYLAVPFLGPEDQIVLILYAECHTLNFFADDDRIRRVVGMCHGFCRLFDWLYQDSFSHLRNFPLQKGQPVIGSDRTVYRIQESIDFVESPRFRSFSSCNYEASVA